MRVFRPPLTAIASLLLGVLIALAPVARAAQALTLLRDPDIEHALKQLAAPILHAAGLGAGQIDILVIDDPNLNAFVMDSSHIYVHSGLIQRMKSAPMLQAVLAHETGHITNGHLMRRPSDIRDAQARAKLGLALAVAAGALTGNGNAALGIALGTQGAAMGSVLAHTRAQESAADQTGMRYLADAGIDPQGAAELMDIFRGQESLSASHQDAWARTHPLSRDRYRVIDRLAQAYADRTRPHPDAEYWFDRAKAKLSAFQRSPKWTLSRAGEFGHEDIKLMRQAVAYHRLARTDRAIKAIDGAIALRPDDPYYLELKGQILIESRNFGAAARAYAAAARIAPRNALILGAYGRALLAEGKVPQAQKYLEKARSMDGRDVRVMRDLAVAYARQNRPGMAAVVTAERYAMLGRMDDALIHAKRASGLLPRGSGPWQRAQDVLSAAERATGKEGN